MFLAAGLEAFGAFCDIGWGINGLLPIDNISVSRIPHPNVRFNVGDVIKVKVIEIDLTSEEYAFGVDKNQPELLEQVNAFITQMEEEELADVIEIDMCCGADYVVKGLTEKGKALISE